MLHIVYEMVETRSQATARKAKEKESLTKHQRILRSNHCSSTENVVPDRANDAAGSRESVGAKVKINFPTASETSAALDVMKHKYNEMVEHHCNDRKRNFDSVRDEKTIGNEIQVECTVDGVSLEDAQSTHERKGMVLKK